MNTNYLQLFLILFMVATPSFYYSQDKEEKEEKKDTISNYSFYKKGFKMGALFVAEYKSSLTHNVDMNGLHNSEGVDSYDGTFLRYVRVSGKYQLNDKISATVLVNLADFKNDPQTRVLENAFIRYEYNSYINIQVGQFRPYFGLEDLYPYEFNKSYVWSNNYDEFGKNGWQSFQLGVALTGSLSKKGIPLNYYISAVNGNGKNKTGDNDKSKDVTARIDYKFFKKLKIGVNGGFTNYKNQKANAYGIDAEFISPITDKWNFAMDAEYKNGTNFNQFNASTIENKSLDDFRMAGFYFTPRLTYNLNKPRIRGIEVSARYEYFEKLKTLNNPRETITPMMSILLADNYAARLSVGFVFDRYKNTYENTSMYNTNYLFSQFQFKF